MAPPLLLTCTVITSSAWLLLSSKAADPLGACSLCFLLTLAALHFVRSSDLSSLDLLVPWLTLVLWLAKHWGRTHHHADRRRSRGVSAAAAAAAAAPGGAPASAFTAASSDADNSGRRSTKPPSFASHLARHHQVWAIVSRSLASCRRRSGTPREGGSDQQMGASLAVFPRILILVCSGAVLLLWRALSEGLGLHEATKLSRLGGDPNSWLDEGRGILFALLGMKLMRVALTQTVRLVVVVSTNDAAAHAVGSSAGEPPNKKATAAANTGAAGSKTAGTTTSTTTSDSGRGEDQADSDSDADSEELSVDGDDADAAARSSSFGFVGLLSGILAVAVVVVVAVLRMTPSGTHILVKFAKQWLWGILVLDFIFCYFRYLILRQAHVARDGTWGFLQSRGLFRT